MNFTYIIIFKSYIGANKLIFKEINQILELLLETLRGNEDMTP